jgi:D-glycero-D-manno-heptose 1,7-bisphosphate phosphatase
MKNEYGTPKPVLWLDLDGTVRHGFDELGRFVNTAADVKVFDGVRELLSEYKRLGWRIVAISNQGGIALGHMSKEDCAGAMIETYGQSGEAFDKIAWCSHHPLAKDPEWAVCWCRKPRIGLLVESGIDLARQHGEYYPPHLGLFVGDRAEDEECAANAGLRFMHATEWRTGKHLLELGSPGTEQ